MRYLPAVGTALALATVFGPWARAQQVALIGNTPSGVIFDVEVATGQTSNP
jgi:hypothetical protein